MNKLEDLFRSLVIVEVFSGFSTLLLVENILKI